MHRKPLRGLGGTPVFFEIHRKRGGYPIRRLVIGGQGPQDAFDERDRMLTVRAGKRCDRNIVIARHNGGAIAEQRGDPMSVRGLDVSAAEATDSPSRLAESY